MATRFDLATDDEEQALEACLAALRADRLVVLPTETVYGLAARQSARSTLDAVKAGRSAPYSLAVSGVRDVDALAELPRGPAHRAAARWWPGPITLVLRGVAAKSVGVRVPGHPFTRQLLARLGEAQIGRAHV